MKSLEFFKPTLATTLAIVLAWLLSVRPAQAGYTVTLQQVGPDVVATGSGAIDLTGLTFSNSVFLGPRSSLHYLADTIMWTQHEFRGRFLLLSTMSERRLTSAVANFGQAIETSANSGSGNMVGIFADLVEFQACSVFQRAMSPDSIGQRDLQRRESCNLRRNTGHLRMDVGNRSEPELHASNKNTGAGKHGDLVLEQQCFCRRHLCSHSSGWLDSSWCGGL